MYAFMKPVYQQLNVHFILAQTGALLDCSDQGCSLGLDLIPSLQSLGLETNISVSSRSRLLTSRLHRTSKLKLKDYNYKILCSLQRHLGCLSISVENRHFCLFLNTVNCLTL